MSDKTKFKPVNWSELPTPFWLAGVDLTGWEVAETADKESDGRVP